MHSHNSFFSSKPALLILLGVAVCAVSQAQPFFHGVAVFKNPAGPNGTNRVHVGDTITSTITITNLDDFGDTLTITQVVDVVYHKFGPPLTNILLSTPTNLLSPVLGVGGDMLQLTTTYPVLAGDESLPAGLLTDFAYALGTDNHDGSVVPPPSNIPQAFFLSHPGEILVLTNAGPICTTTNCAIAAVSDPVYRPSTKPPDRNQAFWMRGITTNLVFYPEPGSWVENLDGTARLAGTLRSLTNLSSGFAVIMNLTGRQTTPPPGSPNKELASNAYTANGGPIDPSTWYYYANFTGTLTGFGFWQGAVISFKPDPASTAFQVGVGANGKNTHFGATGWFNWTVLHQPASGNISAQTTVANINLDLICCAPSEIGDFVWLDVNHNGIQDAGEPGISNVTVRLLDCTNRVVLSTVMTDGNGKYLFGDLLPGSYLVQFVPPSGFGFTLQHQGADIHLDSDADPATGFTQCITLGSNEVNLSIDAGLISNCVPACALGAFSDPTYKPSTKPPGRNQAIWMKGISTNLTFISPDVGHWVENANGTAQLTGTTRSLTNTASGFVVTLTLSGRTSTSPSGSPMLELTSAAYKKNGGPIDPSTWHYYTTETATLTGFGFWQGAVINLTRTSSAFQVGVGANGKNQTFGASGWFAWTVVKQPASGRLPTTGMGDINLDLICCPP